MCLFPSGLKVSCQRCTEIHSSVNIWTKVRDQCIKPNGYWAYLSILTYPQFTPHIIYIYIHICTKTHRHMQMETYSTERPRTFCTYMTHKITRGHMYAKWQTYITHGHIYKTCRDLTYRQLSTWTQKQHAHSQDWMWVHNAQRHTYMHSGTQMHTHNQGMHMYEHM